MEKYLEDIVCLSDIKVINVLIHFFKEKKNMVKTIKRK